MEMQQEFHCVNMNGAPSDELELSSSSTSTSTTTSSSSTSPDYNTAVSSPRIQSPPLLQPQQSVSIPISAPAPLIPSAHLTPRHLTKAQALKSIKESIAHTKQLQRLQNSEREHQKDASQHKKAVRRISKELYQIVGLYALLHGVIFTAVAQSSIFTCEDAWGPAGIFVGLVTLVMITGVLDKLRRMEKKKQEVKKFEIRQSAVYDKIELLYWKGSACSIESLEPAHTQEFEDEPGILSVQGFLVLGFLAGISVLIMVSSKYMLCSPCHCN